MTLDDFTAKDWFGTGLSKGHKADLPAKFQAIITEVNALTNGLVHNISTVSTATYDVLETDEYLYVTRTATGTCAIDLPTAQVVAGRTIYIKDAAGNADTFAITITTEGAETIDGAASVTISSDYGTMMIFCDGTNWDTFTDRPFSDDTKILGPGAVTDEALVRFDGVTGLAVQNSVGTLSDAGALAVATVDIGSSTVISGILDEDAMGSDSDVSLATQQSIKAYADLKILGPGAVTDNAITRYDGTTGLAVQDSLATVDDLGAIYPVGLVNTSYNVKSFATVNAATYDVLLTDEILNVTYTATGTVAIDLKTAQLYAGRQLIIKDAGGNASTFNITITTEGAETIDGAATAVISGDYDSITLYSDGSNYFIV